MIKVSTNIEKDGELPMWSMKEGVLYQIVRASMDDYVGDVVIVYGGIAVSLSEKGRYWTNFKNINRTQVRRLQSGDSITLEQA